MSAVWGVVTRRVVALYLGVSLVGAVVLGWLTNLAPPPRFSGKCDAASVDELRVFNYATCGRSD